MPPPMSHTLDPGPSRAQTHVNEPKEKRLNPKLKFTAAAATLLLTLSGVASAQSTTTFDNGREGWEAAASWIAPRIGEGKPALRTRIENFGVTFANSSNANFIGDYTRTAGFELSLDVFTKSIVFDGHQVSRDLVVELRDHDNAPDGLPYVSVWAKLGTLSASTGGWQTLSITVGDTSASSLPSGWGGTGAEDPVTFEPKLPSDRSFADVLAGIDEIAFTTFTPGFVYGFTKFDVAVDNISIAPIAAVPEPSSLALLGLGLSALAWRTRRTGAKRNA